MKIKTLSDFKASLSLKQPPPELSPYERALWHSGKDEWERAHNLVQVMDDSSSSLIHGFLHRQEGDLPNADYWYKRSGSQMPENSINEEWERLVVKFLAE